MKLLINLACLILLSSSTVLLSQTGDQSLAAYVKRTDSSFSYVIAATTKTASGTYYTINMRSQTWHHIPWDHKLLLYVPHKSNHPETVVLLLRHVAYPDADMQSLRIISDSTGTSSAILLDIPNQPLFDGREEDDLQAYTFSEFMRSGDETWPLLLPMVKSVVRAMDVIQSITVKSLQPPVSRFVLTGHSKRGHTSWLTAASDPRVKGIIPVAIDILNSPAQLPHHLETFGNYNTPSGSTTKILEEINTPAGKRLIEIVDPYSYRKLLTANKLIVSATNDPFFATDALSLYWDSLPGRNALLVLPNADHVSAYSDVRVNATAFAFIRAVSTGNELPALKWSLQKKKGQTTLRMSTENLVHRAIVWIAHSKSRDFRNATWTAFSIDTKDALKIKTNGSGFDAATDKVFEYQIPLYGDGYLAICGELQFADNISRFSLSTQPYVLKKSNRSNGEAKHNSE